MSIEADIVNAINEFWRREKEYLALEPKEFIAALPKNLLPPKNSLPPFTLTEKQWIYRARPIDASFLKGDSRNIISKYSYSPKKFTGQGRANHPNQPMFYGSEFISSTAFESRWNMEKDSLIGCWKVKAKSPHPRLAVCASRFKPELKLKIKDKIPESLMLQLKFLDELFCFDRDRKLWIDTKGGKEVKKETQRDRVHKLSASIAQYLMEREDVDGILYHSAQAQGAQALFPPHDESNSFLNVAISKKYVDTHLALKKVYRVNIRSYDDEHGRRRATREAIRIGVPINNIRLNFTKLNEAQNREFELVHNNSGVPMFLSGPIVLRIPNLENIERCEEIGNAYICDIHSSYAKVSSERTNGIDYTKLEVCCDALGDLLQKKLQSEAIWW